jgi:hypothetical protein
MVALATGASELVREDVEIGDLRRRGEQLVGELLSSGRAPPASIDVAIVGRIGVNRVCPLGKSAAQCEGRVHTESTSQPFPG